MLTTNTHNLSETVKHKKPKISLDNKTACEGYTLILSILPSRSLRSMSTVVKQPKL